MVGTPMKFVTRSRSISSRARNGSHRCIITRRAPVATEPSITGTHPVTWNSGTVRMKQAFGGTAASDPLSGGVSGAHRSDSTTLRQAKANRPDNTARWVDTAPFGVPVVPEVNRMVASSSGDTVRSGIVASGSSRLARWAQLAGRVPSERTTTACTPRSTSRGPMRSIRSRSAMRTFAPESTSPNSISGPVHQALTDTAMAPIEVTAPNEVIHSG